MDKAGQEAGPMSAMDIEEIRAAIPHRYPSLLVDRIRELELDRRIVGIKNVTMNEPFFQGHFADRPIIPGVLIIEAMAQVGPVVVVKTFPSSGRPLIDLTGLRHDKSR